MHNAFSSGEGIFQQDLNPVIVKKSEEFFI